MKHYLYFPFTNYKHDRSFTGTKKRYKHKYGKAKHNKRGEVNKEIFIQGGKGLIGGDHKPLEVVKPGDVLIIMGHGDEDDTKHIHMYRSPLEEVVLMKHNDLAQQLFDEGLNRAHRVIKMICCFGGGDSRFNPSDEWFHMDISKNFFAKLLAMSLGELKYHSIIVGGYDGTVRSNAVGQKNDIGYALIEGAKLADVPKEYTIWKGRVRQPTKGNAIWYDAKGVETKRPPPGVEE